MNDKKDICEIAYQVKIGNKEYLDRISEGSLTEDEYKAFLEAIAKGELK